MQDNLTAKQQDYAVFLPAISGFYATFIGRQRNEPYIDPARFPPGLVDLEQLNWLNSQKALYPYRWSLYSGGHANLDLNKQDWSEDMVRNREPGSFILGDSGGFQIAKGVWEGDWRANSGCPRAQEKREAVLKWLDGISDYGMIMDIPTWTPMVPGATKKTCIANYQDAVEATKFNNDYFMQHRRGLKEGGTRVLNVLQGANHGDADSWYDTMKHYSDPKQHPGRHFDGWAMGGQNMCDVHLVLKRLITLRHDGLLQEGLHDWMHFLGTSKLEWAVLLTVIQRAVRRYANPNFTISFDCASPFLATANGQVYYENVYPHNDKWSYRMAPSADDKRYATDTRRWSTGVLADGIHTSWLESPVSQLWRMQDICHYRPGDLNKNGKEGNTSWDSFSYCLLMSHNVWMHLTAVQEANRRFDAGEYPEMLRDQKHDYELFSDIVDRIFRAPTRSAAMSIIEDPKYARKSGYWNQIIGTRGVKGENITGSEAMANAIYDLEVQLKLDKIKREIYEPDLTHIELDVNLESTKATRAAVKPNLDTRLFEF